MSALNILINPIDQDWGETVEEFLQHLSGPSCIIIDGEDNTRARAYVTLLHGNEPSGVMALFRWLKTCWQQEKKLPAVRMVCIIASVNTALQAPMFHYRTLPGVRDLNRCFKPPFTDSPGRLAKSILDVIYQYQPEAVIDVHNTSGSGPAFGVATHKDEKHNALTLPFSKKLVITHLKLGALMDISEEYFPTVTIEAGGRLDQASHDIAWEGLNHFFIEKDILTVKNNHLESLIEPIRVELNNNVSLCYAATPNPEFDVTFHENLDEFNFTTVKKDTPLGWINRGGLKNFLIKDYHHQSSVHDWLCIKDQQLYLNKNATLFMITTNPVIALDDCIFYIGRV